MYINGAISYLSPVFLGSISDVELTRESGFLKTIDNQLGISIMADRGFTIQGMLDEIGMKLNMPPSLMDGHNSQQRKYKKEERLPHYGYTWNVLLAGCRITIFSRELFPLPWLSRSTKSCVYVAFYLTFSLHSFLLPRQSQRVMFKTTFRTCLMTLMMN